MPEPRLLAKLYELMGEVVRVVRRADGAHPFNRCGLAFRPVPFRYYPAAVVRSLKLNGYVEFPGPLFVALDALGKIVPTKIGDLAVRLHFPSQPPKSNNEAPFLRGPATGRRKLDERLHPPPRWGQQTGTAAQVNVVRITGNIAETTSPLGPDSLSNVQFACRSWFNMARDWIASWSGQPRLLDRITRSAPTIGVSYGLSPRHLWQASEPPTVIFNVGLRPATGEQVRAGFRMAGLGTAAPLHRTLLLDARETLLLGDTRRAVIDAGSAVEVALAEALMNSAKPHKMPRTFVEESILQANGAVGLVKLYTSLGLGPLPVSANRIMNQLAGPRNRAAHSGSSPTAQEASRAISVALSVIDAALPMPSPNRRAGT